jgi:hypothetical protein
MNHEPDYSPCERQSARDDRTLVVVSFPTKGERSSEI